MFYVNICTYIDYSDSWPLNFIGKLEYYQQHWNILQSYSKCSVNGIDNYNNLFGTNKLKHNNIGKYKNNQNHNLSLPYYVLLKNKELYEKIVEYYFQDFVCLGYDMSYQWLVDYINRFERNLSENVS